MSDTPSQPFEINLDASLMKQSACSRYLYNVLIAKYADPSVMNDVQFGSAFHAFACAIYRTKGDLQAALKAAKEVHARPCVVKPKKAYLQDIKYLMKVCFNWYEWHTNSDEFEILLDNNNEPLVEKNFKFPIYDTSLLKINLTGTLDKMGKIKNGCYAIGDYKTSSTTDSSDYFKQYALSVQLRTYYYAIKQYGKLYPDSVFAKMTSAPLGCFIDGIFLRGVAKDPEFVRSQVFMISDEDMKEYETLLHQVVEHVVNIFYEHVEKGARPLRDGIITDSCSGKYGHLCKFFYACAAPNAVHEQHVLSRNFIKKHYDPLTFGKE